MSPGAAPAGEGPKEPEPTPPPTEVRTAAPRVNDEADTPEGATATVQEAAETGVATTQKKIDLVQTAKAGAEWVATKFGYKLTPMTPGTEAPTDKGANKPTVKPPEASPSPEGQLPPREGTPDQLKKAPETYSEQLSQRFDKVIADFKKAEESGDKNAKFKATIEAIAIIIEYIVRAFNCTLGKKIEKDGEKPAKEGSEKPQDGKVPEGTPEAAAKTEVEAKLKEKGQPAKPEKVQEASREVQADAERQKEANKEEIGERQKSVAGLVKENDGLLDQQHQAEEKLNKLQGEKSEDPKVKSQKSVLEDQLKNIKGKMETNNASIKEHKEKIEALTKDSEKLEAKQEAAKKIEQGMEKLKVWMPLVEKMIAITLGLRLGAGGITIGPDGKIVVDLVTPEEQAKAVDKLQGTGAVKGEGKTVVMTQEQIVKAITEMLPTADNPKADQKPTMEQPQQGGKEEPKSQPEKAEEAPEMAELKKGAEEMGRLIHDLPDTAWKAYPDINDHPSVRGLRERMNALSSDPKVATQLERAMQKSTVKIESENGDKKYTLARDDEHEGFYLQEQRPVVESAPVKPASEPAPVAEKTKTGGARSVTDAVPGNPPTQSSERHEHPTSQATSAPEPNRTEAPVPQPVPASEEPKQEAEPGKPKTPVELARDEITNPRSKTMDILRKLQTALNDIPPNERKAVNKKFTALEAKATALANKANTELKNINSPYSARVFAATNVRFSLAVVPSGIDRGNLERLPANQIGDLPSMVIQVPKGDQSVRKLA